MTHRQLTDSEVAALQNQGCRAADWSRIVVRDPFDPARITLTRFSGDVKIGAMSGAASFSGGMEKPCGISGSQIHNCSIGDHVYIHGVTNLANYEIEDHVVVENVASLVVDRETAFGNGSEIEVLNEGGGRPLKIFDRLSAQIAYFLVLYRHRQAMIERLEAMIDEYVQSKTSSRGRLEAGCRVVNCGTIANVTVGPRATVSGALRLEEGTIAGCPEDPALVGEGVIAEKFIFLAGSRVTDGAVVTSSFVGQGARVGRQFSAENSAFFANCEAFHGEACSLFAGPYAATHHKSSLLIAGMFSFYNAGSGTNESNHMYKLGPVHQGILERGAKTGSSSYLLWPCRIGAFSVVIGKHFAKLDTAEFPFSYIMESEGKSTLTPGANLLTVGTRRDAAKWPARDRRRAPEKLDQIGFALFSPPIVGNAEAGKAVLENLHEGATKKQDYVFHKGARIRRTVLRTGAKYYDMLLKIGLGSCLAARLERLGESATFEEIRAGLVDAAAGAAEKWVDALGMIAPARSIEALLDAIEQGSVSDLDSLLSRVREIHSSYEEEEWRWFAALLERQIGKSLSELTPEDLAGAIADWKENAIKLNKAILLDASKEFDDTAKIGCGIDGGEEIRDADFEAVRGRYEDNSFVRELREENETIEKRAEALIARLL